MPNYVSPHAARDILRKANRILVVGCSGTGKTTLSLALSEALALDYISLDRDVFWLPGWTLRARAEQRRILHTLVVQPRWIMDGNSPSTLDIRAPRADLILWIQRSRWAALFGLARRVSRHYGTVRVAMAEGCPEPMPDKAFLSYIWNFERETAPRLEAQIDHHTPTVPVARLTSLNDCRLLLRPHWQEPSYRPAR
jgi:adenylate kinase family enzyme